MRTGLECLETGARGKEVMYEMPGRRLGPASFLVGVFVAFSVFMVLPMTELFAGREIPDNGSLVLTPLVAPPPPPPPIPELEKPEIEPTTAAKSEAKPRLQKAMKPLQLRQLQIALNPGPGNALRGDFSMDFSMSGPAVAEFEIFEVTEVDQPPGVAFDSPIHYPRSMARTGEKGSVLVQFVVAVDGKARDASVRESTHPAFEKPAIDAVMRSRFKAGMREGEAVPVRVLRRYQFQAP